MTHGTEALALAFVLSLASATASGAAKKKAAVGKGEQGMLVIWGGGKTPADAVAAQKAFTAAGFASSRPVTTLFSSRIKGLNPGFHIAVLGVCPSRAAHALLRRARQFYPGVYLRRVTKQGELEALTCPWVSMPKRDWYRESSPDEPVTIEGHEEVVVGALVLRVDARASVETNGEYVSASYTAKATLRQNDLPLDQQLIAIGDYATIEDLSLSGQEIVLTSQDAVSDCKSGLFYEVHHLTRRFRMAARRIAAVEEVTGRESGLCGPDYEGADRCSARYQEARYAAAHAACENAAREACQQAIDAFEAENERDPSCEDGREDGDGGGG